MRGLTFVFSVDLHRESASASLKSHTLRDDFVHMAGRLGFSLRSYEYLPPRGKNKAPLQVAYTKQSGQCVRWMEEVGSIKDSHVKHYELWKKIIETVG